MQDHEGDRRTCAAILGVEEQGILPDQGIDPQSILSGIIIRRQNGVVEEPSELIPMMVNVAGPTG